MQQLYGTSTIYLYCTIGVNECLICVFCRTYADLKVLVQEASMDILRMVLLSSTNTTSTSTSAPADVISSAVSGSSAQDYSSRLLGLGRYSKQDVVDMLTNALLSKVVS